jgi:uncharacterized protein
LKSVLKVKFFVYCLLLIIISSAVIAIPPEQVRLTGFVQDYANVLSASEKAQISEIGQQIYDSKTAQYAVVIVDSFEGIAREDYALRVAQGNLGDSSNNGLLLLISVEDREYRFEVGRGLEATLNDARIGRIGRNHLVPALQENQYGIAVINASTVIRDLLVDGTEVPQQQLPPMDYELLFFFGFMVFFFVISSWSAYYQRKHAKKHGKNQKDDKLLTAAIFASMLLGRRGGGNFGGGGFGGFGGGGFGGGGAGGRF